MNMSKVAWAGWSVLPVIVLAYHFGPGQAVYQRGQAARILSRADDLESKAQAAQDFAHQQHLAWVQARKKAVLTKAPEDERAASKAAADADAAYVRASQAWHATADSLTSAQSILESLQSPKAGEVRIAKDRALIRSGEIASGVNDLDGWLDELTDKGQAETPLARQARAEVAAGYYYAARLMRLAGKPTNEWMEAASWARQNFRYVAEEDAAAGDLGDQQKNLELALNLEQSGGDDLISMPLARNSPSKGNTDGLNKLGNGNGKKTKKPPQNKKDARGAGGVGDLPPGW